MVVHVCYVMFVSNFTPLLVVIVMYKRKAPHLVLRNNRTRGVDMSVSSTDVDDLVNVSYSAPPTPPPPPQA